MILVTGSAGFIGFHVSQRLLREGNAVHGLDNLNGYYDVGLKEARNAILKGFKGYTFSKVDLSNATATDEVFSNFKPALVIHLAAQAGVRHSLSNPRAYAESNLNGFLNVLEGSRTAETEHLIYASSSSVYGLNTTLPFSVHQASDHPVSFYAATKKANELMAHSYSHLYGIPTTGLRLFTVYGPWGRPDMALFAFTKAILEGKPIEIFGDGKMRRDFTYIDDVVEGIVRILKRPAMSNPLWTGERPDPASSSAPYRLHNIGNHSTIEVLRLIEVLEDCLGIKAEKRFVSSQACEVQSAIADSSELATDTGYLPSTSLENGVRNFVGWYREFYQAH
jgi:UDP-glucuronate 4-epimerase